MATLVEISFYKPNGFADAHELDTDDRGEAIRIVLGKYPPDILKFLNYVTARNCSSTGSKTGA